MTNEFPCVHRGEFLRVDECQTCHGSPAEVFACPKVAGGECAVTFRAWLRNAVGKLPICATCKLREEPEFPNQKFSRGRDRQFARKEDAAAPASVEKPTLSMQRLEPNDIPCLHRGGLVRTERCGCGGRDWTIDVHECKVHAECTVFASGRIISKQDKSGSVKVCLSCHERQVPELPEVLSHSQNVRQNVRQSEDSTPEKVPEGKQVTNEEAVVMRNGSLLHPHTKNGSAPKAVASRIGTAVKEP